MMNLRDYLLEEKSKAIKHLTHLGGEAHLMGKDETVADLSRLENLHKYLTNQKSSVTSVGIKADGSPSFEMGHVYNPETNENQFGVAYKGAAKGYAFSQEDIDKRFEHSPGLHSKMSQLLQHGHNIVSPIHGVIQGDFMGSKKDGTIQDEGDQITHKENLIKYGYPKNSDEAKTLRRAKISVSLHTRIDKEQPEYNIDTDKLHSHPDVHVFNNKMSRKNLVYGMDQQDEFNKNFEKAKNYLSLIRDHDELVNGHTEHMQTYINKTVREGTNPTVAGYQSHLKTRLQKDVDKVSRPKNKLNKSIEMQNMLQHIDTNQEEFTHLFTAHKHLDNAKNVMLRSLENSGQNQTHTVNGQQTKPEGFVVGYNDGSVSKVVNRSKEGFSGLNLNK